MQTRVPWVEAAGIAGEVAVEIRDGVGCLSGHVGPRGQWPSRYALHTGTSEASPKPKVFVRKGLKEKLKLGSRGASGETIRSAIPCTSADMAEVVFVVFFQTGELQCTV